MSQHLPIRRLSPISRLVDVDEITTHRLDKNPSTLASKTGGTRRGSTAAPSTRQPHLKTDVHLVAVPTPTAAQTTDIPRSATYRHTNAICRRSLRFHIAVESAD